MGELNQQIQWKPKTTGEGRFGNWLANANDWNLSRSRYWGIPLPIWRTEDGKESKIIGSAEELMQCIHEALAVGHMKEHPFPNFKPNDFSESNYEAIDLHKDTVDHIVLNSTEGKPMYREADLIDVWFDSGAMPYAQWHYPFENKEKIDSGSDFPADYIAEGVDQTRGWFYTLHAIGTLVFDSIAYKNVISNGLVLDKNAQKMSKRLGNAIDPFNTLDTYGPDATRWYMIANANPWDNLKFDLEGIAEVQRKFFGTLYNTYSFFSIYANIDRFTHDEPSIPIAQRPELDRWILSELNSLIQDVDAAYEAYEPTKAARAIASFVQEKLSNWYVRLSRRRFWKGDYQDDKIAAYQTLYKCLLNIAQLSAPIAPFYADHLYQDLIAVTPLDSPASVHLFDFPVADANAIDPDLELRINKARLITSLALSLRKKEQIKVRQPLQKLIIPVKNNTEQQAIQKVQEQLMQEINVKEIELLEDANALLVREVKPNFKVLGPKYGPLMKTVVAAIHNLSTTQIQQLEEGQSTPIGIDDKQNIELNPEDIEIYFKDIEGWQVAQGNGLTVALDITLTPELIDEGIARELVNRIQNIRKDSGFEITDTIEITIQEESKLEKAVAENKAYIMDETLCKKISFQPQLQGGLELAFDQINSQILIQKTNRHDT